MRNIAVNVAALLIVGCATVETQVTLLDPSAARAPATDVAILLEPATRPHVSIALIEVRGISGTTEGELLAAARGEAARIGADAVVRLSVTETQQPPMYIYDPVFSPYYSRYGLRAGTYFYPPYLGYYRPVGGGTERTLKALAIRYGGAEARGTKP